MHLPKMRFQVENRYLVCPEHKGFHYDTVVYWLREIYLTS